jgi:hypothetical protein
VAEDLWTCPKCGAKLITRNLAHSCGRATLDDWKARMGPRARRLYHRFERMIAACGKYHVAPAKTRIAFLARVRFAGITHVSEKGMTCAFSLPQPVRSDRFVKVEEVVPGWWVHRLRVSDPGELDDELQAWLRESYRLMGMQERLTRRTTRRRAGPALLVLLTLLAAPLPAQDSLLVEIAGATRALTHAELRALPADTVVVQFHDGPRHRFVGPSLAAVLTAAGGDLDSLRGRGLAQYVLVEASDGYRVVFAVAELTADFRATRTILALSVDGAPLARDGPFRVIAEGDLRPARSARNVVALRLRAAAPG